MDKEVGFSTQDYHLVFIKMNIESTYLAYIRIINKMM